MSGNQKAISERRRYVLFVLNTGDSKSLQKLNTIGPKTSDKIIDYRYVFAAYMYLFMIEI